MLMTFRILDPKRCGDRFPGKAFLNGITQLKDLDPSVKKKPGSELALVDISK